MGILPKGNNFVVSFLSPFSMGHNTYEQILSFKSRTHFGINRKLQVVSLCKTGGKHGVVSVTSTIVTEMS